MGIYGTVNNLSAIKMDLSKEMEVAKKDLDGNGAKEYLVEIEKIFINNDYDNKSMLIKIKSPELLEKTGGIIQGMSGCPLIQNGKFIGAITNVIVR